MYYTHISLIDSDKGRYSAEGIGLGRRSLVHMHVQTQTRVLTPLNTHINTDSGFSGVREV